MKPADREDLVAFFRNLLEQHGPVPQALDLGLRPRQDVRFGVLGALLESRTNASVLDVGCGLGDLCGFLRAKGWNGKYVGIDIVPELIDNARKRFPNEDFRVLDLAAQVAESPPDQLPGLEADFVYESGIFNYTLPSRTELANANTMLSAMFSACRVAVVCDWMSSFVDFVKPGTCHWSPETVLIMSRRLTRRITLRMDYLPFEFAVTLWKDDDLDERGVFAALKIPGVAPGESS
jgi:SAM-dependent methyltransferase